MAIIRCHYEIFRLTPVNASARDRAADAERDIRGFAVKFYTGEPEAHIAPLRLRSSDRSRLWLPFARRP